MGCDKRRHPRPKVTKCDMEEGVKNIDFVSATLVEWPLTNFQALLLRKSWKASARLAFWKFQDALIVTREWMKTRLEPVNFQFSGSV